MASNSTENLLSPSTSSVMLPLSRRSRRGSLASISSSTQLDKDALSQALDHIHTSASRSGSLTAFNEYGSPPSSSTGGESKGLAGDLVQAGLSGLYSRFRGAVGGVKEKPEDLLAVGEGNKADRSPSWSPKPHHSGLKSPLGEPKSPHAGVASPAAATTGDSPMQSGLPPSIGAMELQTERRSKGESRTPSTVSKAPSRSSTATAAPSSSKSPLAPFTKPTIALAVTPAIAPVHVAAYKANGSHSKTLSIDEPSQPPHAREPSTGSNRQDSSETHRDISSRFTTESPDSIHATSESRLERDVENVIDGNEAAIVEDEDGMNEGDADSLDGSWSMGRDDAPDIRRTPQTATGDSSRNEKTDTKSPSRSKSKAVDHIGPERASMRAHFDEQAIAHQSPAAAEPVRKHPPLQRISTSHLPGYSLSRTSSFETIGTSPILSTATDALQEHSREDGARNDSSQEHRKKLSGTFTESDPETVNAIFQQIKSKVLNRDFWMRDENCKQCYHCGDAFSTWRRKHHCRTCGQIFDAKCTSLISGARFGHSGSLRVCKPCMEIINGYTDAAGGLEDSDDDTPLPTTFFNAGNLQKSLKEGARTIGGDVSEVSSPPSPEDRRPLQTPMMAIPATRKAGDLSKRRSAILEINSEGTASRPSSSRSFRISNAGRPFSSTSRRHRSRHQHSRSIKSFHDERAPFQRNLTEDTRETSRLPAFHNDSIIDPDLAPYMSDEGSSEDEQVSIFAAMNKESLILASNDGERSTAGSFLGPSRKNRSRLGDKSGSVNDDASVTSSRVGVQQRSQWTRHPSFGNHLQQRPSPKVLRSGNPFRGFNSSFEALPGLLGSHSGQSPPRQSKMTRSASMKGATAPAVELNKASLLHVRRLLRQLLHDANIPNVGAWEHAMVPILLQCTDDVNPDVRHGDDIDIRHYVKIKKVSGGRPSDTAYVSGVVFSKNLALKSMPRSISHPRIVIITFSIEYHRNHRHFMSLEPVIAQEKEFLRNLVNRIIALRPHLVLVQRDISGLALQYLGEANISVAFNVKAAVLEAVSRCAQADIISSIDMLALKPVQVGKSAAFDTRTYISKEKPGRRKTYLYLSGCPPDLGCTIVLRGADAESLGKIKRITDFMIYVVYNLKLETCLMRDEFVLMPSTTEEGTLRGGKGLFMKSGTDQARPDSGASAKQQEQDVSAQASADVCNADITKHAQFEQNPTSEPQTSTAASDGVAFVPEDVPMPTFYGDMVEKYQTKILSASPFVKFMQPYLLMRAREQERRLAYLKRLRDQEELQEAEADEKVKPQKFSLIRPEMVHRMVQGAPKSVMEVLHAVHDAEYDKALHNYQTQKKQWEAYIAGNINLFDPYAHQNIVVLYTVVCTATTIPCAGPDLLALEFYNEHEMSGDFDSDCTLGQFVEGLCQGADTVCSANGCERKMLDHHRSYVHGEARISVFVEKQACKMRGLQDSILMWSFCKVCKKETQVMPMSESTWKYSFGKYLELSFWSTELRLRASYCPHDFHRDHIRYFGYKNVALRIHYDPIELLEIIVPRARITWKVDNDLRLKNESFLRTEERINRFMGSVKARIKGISVDTVLPEKADTCKVEIERLLKRANEDHSFLIRKLQDKYMSSKHYEIIPLNRAMRAMQKRVVKWDAAFADFDADFFPSEKDIRRLAALQLRKIFLDRDESVSSIASTEEGTSTTNSETDENEKPSPESIELAPKPTQMSAEEAHDVLTSVIEEDSGICQGSMESQRLLSDASSEPPADETLDTPRAKAKTEDMSSGSVQHLDLAVPTPFLDTSSPRKDDPDFRSVSPRDRSVQLGKASNAPNADSTSGLAAPKTEEAQGKRTSLTSTTSITSSGIPIPAEGLRRSRVVAAIPHLSRAQSQPPIAQGNQDSIQASASGAMSHQMNAHSALAASSTDSGKHGEKRLSERLGLAALKAGKKGTGLSHIPRSVPSKKSASRVSNLAKHFDQLSREFEKERLRERRQRAATIRQSRAYPMTSSKPIVEVYGNAHEAVEEREPPELRKSAPSEALAMKQTSTVKDSSPPPEACSGEETQTEFTDEDRPPISSQVQSDVEVESSDADATALKHALGPEMVKEESALSPIDSQLDIKIDLPKHERSSLMKMLTNFWAERSASGWTPLEYPMNGSDHVFLDSDVIVREDEPSSLVAFAMSSEDYKVKLDSIRNRDGSRPHPKVEDGAGGHEHHFESNEEWKVERSLLRQTGTHLKYQFQEGSATMLCKVFYAEQFDAVRRKCGVAERIIESMSRCFKWDSKGGKTKSVFLKTLDQRFVLKSLSLVETQAFIKFAPAYFQIIAEALFHELPTVIAKMLGFYQIIIKNPATGSEIKLDLLLMENLFYDRDPQRIFDLKGSMRNRKIQSTGEQNEVLLDENMVEFIYESPLFAREHSKKLLRASVWNDTLFLARQNVMDYSLMIAIDEVRKELVVGIVDCIRTYTWDKKLESWIKDRGRNKPTVTSPKEYKSRFREAMARYVLQAPNCWHQFQAHIEKRPLPTDASVEVRAPEQGEAEVELVNA